MVNISRFVSLDHSFAQTSARSHVVPTAVGTRKFGLTDSHSATTDPPDLPGRNARHEGKRRHIPCDHCTCGDESSLAHLVTTYHRRIRADRRPTADHRISVLVF